MTARMEVLNCMTIGLSECDKRFTSINKLIEKRKMLNNMIGLIPSLGTNKSIEDNNTRIANLNLSKEIVAVEKMVYNAIIRSNIGLLPRLKERYNTLVIESIEHAHEMVLQNIISENEYLQLANGCVEQENYINFLCSVTTNV